MAVFLIDNTCLPDQSVSIRFRHSPTRLVRKTALEHPLSILAELSNVIIVPMRPHPTKTTTVIEGSRCEAIT